MVNWKEKFDYAYSRLFPTAAGISAIAESGAREVKRRSEQTRKENMAKSNNAKPKSNISSTPIQDRAKQRNNQTVSSGSNIKAVGNKQDIQSMIVRIALEEGVDPALALSIAQIESGFNPNAIGDNGKSQGLFQIYGPAHPDYKGGTDPEANTRYGLRLFKGLLDRNGGSVNKAIWAYNAGQGNVDKGILPASTKDYINRVAALGPQYRQMGISADAPVSPENRAIIQSMDQSQQATTQGQGRIQDNAELLKLALDNIKAPEPAPKTEELKALEQQMIEDVNNSRTSDLSIPNMYQQLQDRYAQLDNTINAGDPRYQGEIVQGQRYYVDPKEYQQRAQYDRIAANTAYMMGRPVPTQSRAQDYLDEQLAQYQIAKANEAGVPYADYQAALLDRQKQQISAQAAQIESNLKMALANEDNIFRKQQIIAQIENNAVSAQNAMNQLEYQYQNNLVNNYMQGQQNMQLQELKNANEQAQADRQFKRNLFMEQYKNKLGIERDAAKPQSQSNEWGGLNAINGLVQYDTGKAGVLLGASGLGQRLFPYLTPEQAQSVFGSNKPKPSQGGIMDWLRQHSGIIGGNVQANEQ